MCQGFQYEKYVFNGLTTDGVIIVREPFYQCHIRCAHLKGRLPSNHQGKNKTYSTQYTWIIHITITKLSSFTPLEKQTNKQMRAPRGEWWITLTASYIIFVRFPNITSTDTSAGTKFCLLWGKGKYLFVC